MRVVYFSQAYSTHDHRFLSALAKTEHEVFYLRLEGGRRQVEDRPVPPEIQQVQWSGGRETFHWREVPRLVYDFRRVVRELRPDLVHAGPIQTCAFVAALSGFRPLLTMSWGFDLMQDAERNQWWRAITRYTLRRSTFFVSDAQVTRAKAIEYGMHPKRTAVFPWGVDLEKFAPARGHRLKQEPARSAARTVRKPPKAGRAESTPFTLFCNRSWEPRYGVDVLAKAFVQVAAEEPRTGLLLLGGGSMAQPIRRILMNGNALDQVQLPGQVPQADLPRWYQMADLFISPSHVDGSSVSLMEALACGLPALVSDIPANQEWVQDGVNGWLFPDGDASALAKKILAVIEQRGELGAVRRAARRSAEERADWSKNFRVLLQAYQQAVEAAR